MAYHKDQWCNYSYCFLQKNANLLDITLKRVRNRHNDINEPEP
jgi:hypothetical protein